MCLREFSAAWPGPIHQTRWNQGADHDFQSHRDGPTPERLVRHHALDSRAFGWRPKLAPRRHGFGGARPRVLVPALRLRSFTRRRSVGGTINTVANSPSPSACSATNRPFGHVARPKADGRRLGQSRVFARACGCRVVGTVNRHSAHSRASSRNRRSLALPPSDRPRLCG